MPLRKEYVVLCDEVRQENNGKFILIGVYAPDMTVTQLPATLAFLTFFVVMTDDRPDQHQFRLQVANLETGQVVAQGMGGFQSQRPGMVVLPIRIGPIQFASAGAYTFSLNMDNERDPITHSFNVLLVTPQQPTGIGGLHGGRH